ncbi:MAG TPA: threonine/serine exporter family protein [Actinophytocola sp.]|uniref:threonine/serine exporter family protein n=1 Tax=Actinophytocola sp. TaxID=1872138 RepID=UPI002DBAEA5A|nr:threonine/serine exporter family protein [Actinophytocola sp.]HEU5471663.1 threonine/serine exporter family protein [Actinophytocola sp.]
MTTPDPDAFALLARLTEVLLRWSYEGTAGAERIVAGVAARYGLSADVTFLADAAILTVGERTVARSGSPTVPPLDQVSASKRLLGAIDRGEVSAGEALRRLDELCRAPARWGPGVRVAGLVLFSVGFGISVQATWQEVIASAGLGLTVGLLVPAADNRPRFALVLPFLGSVAVTALVLVAYRQDWIDGGPIQLIIPALFYFIPGDAPSAAMLELADGRISAGATRLVYGLAVLLMLGFGALTAVLLLGMPQSALFDVDVAGNLGPVAVAGGWVLFALGVMFTFSMAPADFPLALVLGTAAVVTAASAVFGDAVGTFIGAVAMTVAALLLGRGPNRPPPYVLYLGAFYVLTPGSHGLRGIESWIGGHPVQGVAGVAEMLGMLTAIGVGMLIGAAAVRRPLSAGT